MPGSLAATALKRLARTLRWQVQGLEQWQGPALLLCWHGEILLGGALLTHLGRAAQCVAPLVREYGQSQAMTDFAHTLGLHIVPVPGYEQPEARRAALLALRAHTEAGQSLFMAADGHRAPARVVAEDPLWLAPALGVPLLPLALAARPALSLPTWDRKQLPLPGSRVGVAIGPALPGELSADALRTQLAELAGRAARLARG